MGRRVKDWENKLHVYVTKNRHRKFRWGQFDCLIFANGWVKEATGIDIIKDSGLKWTSKKSHEELQKQLNVDHWSETAVEEIGKYFKPINTSFAQRGDLVMVPTEQGLGMGIVYGRGILALSPDGAVVLPSIMEAKKAWRID